MQTDYEYIVLGCGGIGSAALYWLSKRAGAQVLGIEQFPLLHSNGSSQDHSRIIRLAYHEAHYARLTPHAYRAWATVADESGVAPVIQTGGVLLAHLDSPGRRTVESYAESMQSADIPFEQLTTDELRYRFPQFQPGSEVLALYQPQTGIADPAKGTATHIALARANGASVRAECPVMAIVPHPDGSGAVVETAQGHFSCRRLVVTAGAWTASLLESVGMRLPLTVTQEQVTYFATPHLKEFAIGRFPVFQWKDEFSCYGFPIYGEVATKAAIDASGPAVTPQSRSFEPDPEREQRLERFLGARIPGFVGPKLYSKTCLYTLPPDRDFILDQLPEAPQVTVFVGAGHAYKFASLLGHILSDLAVDGRTPHDIAPFRLNRPAITDPQFVPDLTI